MPTPRNSRHRFRTFLEDYKQRRLDEQSSSAALPKADEPEKGQLKRWLKPGTRRSYLGNYLNWLKPHRWAIAGVFALALIAAGFQMVEPLFMRFIIDRVLLNKTLNNIERVRLLNIAGAVFLTVVVLNNLTGALKDFRQQLLNVRVILSLRRSLFERFLHLPLPKLWDMKTGGILSRLTGDIETTTGLLQLAIISPSISVIRLLIAVVILVRLNWRLALMALAIIPGIVLVSLIFAKRVRPIYRSLRKDAEAIDGRVGETFSGIRVVRAFRREVRELLEYMVGRHTIVRKEMFARRRELVIWTTWGLIMGIVNVVIMWYGGYLYVRGGASIGDIMAFQWYTWQLLNPVWSIVNSFSELQRSLAATERVFEVLAMPNDKPDRPDARDADDRVEEIRFEDVEFEYRENLPVVRDFSVTVPGGSVIALAGRSGAGKTTVTDLVARFHDPARGRILLNGTDIRELRLASYRKLLGIVQQDVFLFDGSIRDNIAYGRVDATFEEVQDAAQRANAHEFIVKLPDQYETFIGERGVKLSGGQQQRLAIARAILADPQILILDEATSNLDTESEQLIQAAMTSLLADRTTFMIAHRLSTIRKADLILLMEDGRIIERGNHEELMEKQGAYYEMVLRQMNANEEDALLKT